MKHIRRVLNVVTIVLFAAGTMLLLSVLWLFRTFPHVHLEELIYQLKSPITGTNQDVVMDFIYTVICPVVVLLVVITAAMIVLRKKEKVSKYMQMAFTALAAFAIGLSGTMLNSRLNVFAYFRGNSGTDYIEEMYVDPANVNITFPEQKRNVIYIYLESMEMTYASKDIGGAFDTNIIPELTELSQLNENFSGSSSNLNGAVALNGTTWTMGALFGSGTGLPLKISIEANSMDSQDEFFSSTTAFGDILQSNGYKNLFMLGSDAVFGGRKEYFSEHGNYEILDYPNMLENHKLPTDDYRAWWGYQDVLLFHLAKEKLTELGEDAQPFNFTMLTVDTHAEDGYYCVDCEELYGEQYANVMACSSKKVAEFVNWCKEQPWYENTTIIIQGDHTTMDSDFCDHVPDDYQRKVFVSIINSAVENTNEAVRNYSTFDMFPTALRAMGANIEGNRLGLGTDLYSGEETLSEAHGIDEMNERLSYPSAFMEERANIQKTEEDTAS